MNVSGVKSKHNNNEIEKKQPQFKNLKSRNNIQNINPKKLKLLNEKISMNKKQTNYEEIIKKTNSSSSKEPEKKLKELEYQIVSLKEENRHIESAYKELKEKLEESTNIIQELKHTEFESAFWKEKYNAIKEKYEQMEAENLKLKEYNELLKNKIDGFEGTLTLKVSGENIRLHRENKNLIAKNNKYQDLNNQLKKEIEKTNENHDYLLEKHKSHLALYQEKVKENKQLDRSIIKMEKNHESLHHLNHHLKKDIIQMINDINHLKKHLEKQELNTEKSIEFLEKMVESYKNHLMLYENIN